MNRFTTGRATISGVTSDGAGPTDEAGSDDTEPRRPDGPPSRLALTAVVVPIIALVVANNIGNAFAPALLPDPSDPSRSSNPLLLIALSPAMRNQIAVVNYVAPALFLVVAGLRLLAPDPFFFALGRWYGDAGIRWMEKRSAMAGGALREIERWFTKAAPVVVFIAPNNLICVLAGAAGMRRTTFWVANVTGTIARLLLIMWFADLLSGQIDTVLTWVADYRPWLLGISIIAVAVVGIRQLRSGNTELDQLRRLEHELDSPPEDTTPGD